MRRTQFSLQITEVENGYMVEDRSDVGPIRTWVAEDLKSLLILIGKLCQSSKAIKEKVSA